jgi:recombination protein RecA
MATKAAATKAQELMEQVNAALGAKGKPPVVRMASDPEFVTTYTPTGLLPMDVLLQGGMPRGRFVELFGDWSTLKSYIGYNTCAQFQRLGMTAAVIDTEHSFDADWAQECGVDVKNLIIQRPESGELAIDIMETLVRGGVDFILVDSISTLLPEAEMKKRLHDESLQPARLAQLMSAGLRRLTAANTHTSILWINQTRVNIGITFGSNEATTGGKAMPFYASMRIAMRKAGKINRDTQAYTGEKWQSSKEQIGQVFRAEILKSKLSKPFREVWFTWNLETGDIDLVGFLIAQGMELGLITQKGSSWEYDGMKVIGKDKFKAALNADTVKMAELENAVRAEHGLSLIPIPKITKTTASRSLTKKPLRRK